MVADFVAERGADNEPRVLGVDIDESGLLSALPLVFT
jgi:hypothetical protein